MDCDGMPPMLFVTTDNEMLLDDTLMLVERLHEAGIDTTCHVWPLLPHAFPVFDRYFRESRQVRADIVAFARQRLLRAARSTRSDRLRAVRSAGGTGRTAGLVRRVTCVHN